MAKRIRYKRGSLDSTMKAAIKVSMSKPVYVFATYEGYTIDNSPPPLGQQYYKVDLGKVVFAHWEPGEGYQFEEIEEMPSMANPQEIGMWYDEKEGAFKTKHLTMYFDFDTGEVRVEGPEDFTDTWLDIPKAVKSAELFTPYVPSPGWALAHAIHEQWSEYRGYVEEKMWRKR